MLVLGRRSGEALMVGNRRVLVESILNDDVLLTLTVEGQPPRSVNVGCDERVEVFDGASLLVISIRDGKVRLGFDGPSDIQVWREEIYLKMAKKEAARRRLGF
jgi:carbon storage regulator CsrA